MPRSKGQQPVFVCEVDIDSLAIPDTLTQTYQLVNVLHKEKYLHVLLSTPANVGKTTIIFCNRTETANLLEYMLRLLEHRVTALHSGMYGITCADAFQHLGPSIRDGDGPSEALPPIVS